MSGGSSPYLAVPQRPSGHKMCPMDKQQLHCQLVISTDPNGQIHLGGPVIANTVAAYGLLECAKDILRAHAAQQAQAVVPPPPGLNGQRLRITE